MNYWARVDRRGLVLATVTAFTLFGLLIGARLLLRENALVFVLALLAIVALATAISLVLIRRLMDHPD